MPRSTTQALVGWFATAAVLLVCDLVWLGLVARPIYAELMGPLLRDPANWVAGLIFYLFYVTVCWLHAVRDAPTVLVALKKGAGLGLVGYAVYELTNWAVIAGWPAVLVPIDIVWGVVLTGLSAAGGAWASHRVRPPA